MKIKSSVAVACFLPGRAEDLSAPLYIYIFIYIYLKGACGRAVGWGTALQTGRCGFDSRWCHWNF